MKKNLKSIFDFLKKVKRYKEYRASFIYAKYLEKISIDDHTILLESRHGNGIDGNIFYILEELSKNKKYKKFKIYVTIDDSSYQRAHNLLNRKKIKNVTLLKIHSAQYCKVLASAKYLVNDTTFSQYFIKKTNQIYLNTWHGTPLKTLGRKVKSEPHSIGNVQRNFLMADYLLYPNIFTMERIIEDYMIGDLYTNKVILTGYPRNTAFLNIKNKRKIKRDINASDKQIIAYMPTWRGTVSNLDIEKNYLDILCYLNDISNHLRDNQLFYVNFHPFIDDMIDYSKFSNIKPFSTEYETYEFLNACDILVTDYSSVFFDYANTRNKVIIFDYDREEYLINRGTYLNIDDLPFPKVQTVEELIKEINLPKSYNDNDFLKEYCKYDTENVTSGLCERVILNVENKVYELNLKSRKKENILIYAGNLSKNGITTSLLSLLNKIDLTKKNYYLTFNSRAVNPNINTINKLPYDVRYIVRQGNIIMTLSEALASFMYFRLNIKNLKIVNIINDIFRREYKRVYNNIKFDYAVHFSGYESRIIHLLEKNEGNNIIYVHNDMLGELKTKGNQHKNTLLFAYNAYNKVVVVSEDIRASTLEFMCDDSHITVVDNTHDFRAVIDKANYPVVLDEDTEINATFNELKEILNSDAKKIITIGRFSKEKGHERLMRAFNKVWINNQNIYLIIIGGYGPLHQETLGIAEKLECARHILIIKSISNPFPILKKCDLFVLSSFYEGLGLVMLEADTLGVPVISTRVTGPTKFLEKYGGYLVDNSEEGIYKGINDYLEGKVKPMNIDFEEYNKEAVKKFESLFKK
jgi:CDP-glycerol glycerophosphotransferase